VLNSSIESWNMKSAGEALFVAPDLLHEHAGFDAIKLREILVAFSSAESAMPA
jgi:hypothetical protein